MKKIVLILCLLAGFAAAAQPAIKLYGFSRQVIPGNVPAGEAADEANPSARAGGVRTEYYIYVSVSPGAAIRPVAMYIKGSWDTVAHFQAVTTPVMDNQDEKKTLVPFTKQKVLLLQKGDSLHIPVPKTAGLSFHTKSSELVILYIWRGKRYYASLKKLTQLEPFRGI